LFLKITLGAEMLSPNVIETSEDIATAFGQFRTLQSFASTSRQIVVSPLSPDPDWLPPLRTRIASLGTLGAQWLLDNPKVMVAYFQPFVNYATTFGAFAESSQKFGNNIELWTDALTALQKAIVAARQSSAVSAKSFTAALDQIKIVEGLLNQSLTTAWQELADEEQEIVEIATQIVRLQDRVDQLNESISGAYISSGKDYFKTAATISYTVMTAAEVEFPYLEIVTELYTVGKMAYDLIVTDAEIADALAQIADLTVKASQDAQAAAMSKGVIQLITSLNTRVSGLNDKLPALDRMWETEGNKVAAALDAIRSGAVPSQVFDLVSMPAAAAGWSTLSDLVTSGITQDGVIGKPVFLTNAQSKPKFSATKVY